MQKVQAVCATAITLFRICLAWICRDQLQGMGLGQMEQLLQDCGCGPELLAACL